MTMSEKFSRRDLLKKSSAVILGMAALPALNQTVEASTDHSTTKTSGRPMTQIYGRITDQQMNPISKVLVKMDNQQTFTNEHGQFQLFCALPEKLGCKHTVRLKLSASGYQNLDLYVAPSQNGNLAIYNCPIAEDRSFQGSCEFNVSLKSLSF